MSREDSQYRKLHSDKEGKTAKSPAIICDYNEIPLSEKPTAAINNLLNPDSVIPLKMKNQDEITVEFLRTRFMCSFYGIGPDDLWYTDVFAG